MRALAALLAGLAVGSPAPASVDVVYAQRPSLGSSWGSVVFSWNSSSQRFADGFRIFRGRSRPSDVLPRRSTLRLLPDADVTQSRLLLAVDEHVRIYAAPTRDRNGVCFAVDALPRCTYTLLHGLDPHVELAGRSAPGSVPGLANDSIVRVDVDFGSRPARARLGRNGFYLRLRPRSPAPTQLVAFDSGGRRHVYLVRPCPPEPPSLPLAGGAWLVPPVQCG